MNFLEQLVAEWYSYQGHFVRTNIKFGKRSRGGWAGEMDVIALDPSTGVLTHIETSTDSDSWGEREVRFARKFAGAREHLNQVCNFPIAELRQVAIVANSLPSQDLNLGANVTVMPIPQLIRSITAELANLDPLRSAVPESYPLLRALQFGAFYGRSRSDHR